MNLSEYYFSRPIGGFKVFGDFSCRFLVELKGLAWYARWFQLLLPSVT